MLPQVDLDATIKAFEILSDRVSNVEDRLDTLLDVSLHDHQQRYGEVPSSLFGFPRSCDIVLEQEHLSKNQLTRPSRSDAVIMHFSFRACKCPYKFGYGDDLPEPRSYYEDLEEKYEKPLVNADLGIDSTFEFLFEEVKQRVIRRIALSPRFQNISVVSHEWDDSAFAVSLMSTDSAGEKTCEFLGAARDMLRFLHPGRSCWKRVSLWDVERAPLQHYLLSMQVDHCRDPEKKRQLL